MKEVFVNFLEASKESDELSLEGYFGEDVKDLVRNRDLISTNEHLYNCLKLWIDNPQYGDDKIKEFILILFDLYLDAVEVGGQEAIDIISSFWLGTAQNPEMECFSAYTEYARIFTETKELFRQPNSKLSEKKKVVAATANTYSKGVELIGKVLTILIILKKITHKDTYNYMKIYSMTLAEKIELFNKDKNPRHSKLTSVINRPLRNAEAHLSLNFNFNKAVFLLKKKVKGRIIHEQITYEKMITEMFMGVSHVTQAFIYSGILLILALDDKEKFILSIDSVYGK